MQVASSSGVAGITEKHRKAFEVFLAALVTARVASEADVQEVADKYREICKHKGEDFDEMMHESALWMKQCVPGGNKKWSLDMSSFNKKGFDLFFHYAPKEIRNILKSGGQPLLNIFSHSLTKDAHASLKTINLHNYEKLVKEKVSTEEIIDVYLEHGFSKMTGEETEQYIERCIMLDYKNAHDDSTLIFNPDVLIEAPEIVLSSFDNGFTLYTYFDDMDLDSVEAQASALNKEELKKMVESVLKDAGVNEVSVEFVKQEKIDDTTIDLHFKSFSTESGENEGFASVVLTKPELYKEVIENKEVVVAAKKRTYHDDMYDMLENWNEGKITAIKNKIVAPNSGQKHYLKLQKDVEKYIEGMGDLSNEIAECAQLIREDKIEKADKLQEKNDAKLAKLEEMFKTKIEPFVVKYAHAAVSLSDQDLQKFSSLCSQMEPENLYMDGEISVKAGEARLKQLKKEWEALEKKLGIKVTPQEIFDIECGETDAAPKKFYIGERHNPQFDKPYYIKYGPLNKTEVKKKEDPRLYGSMFLTPYDTEEEMNAAAEELVKKGFRVSNR